MPHLNLIRSHGYTLAFIGSGVAAAIILTILLTSVFSFTKEKYAIDVQAIKDEEDIFNAARVAITNTGKLPLTNVIVNYGATEGSNNNNNNNKFDKIALLQPGQKVWLSPPTNVPIKSIRITTDQGVTVTKQYASTFKIPGIRIR
jgi:hypothetical protein